MIEYRHEYPRTKPGSQPEYLHEAYQSTVRRAPSHPPIRLPHTLSELTGPVYGHNPIGAADSDLTSHFAEPPQGERIIKRPTAPWRRAFDKRVRRLSCRDFGNPRTIWAARKLIEGKE